MPASKSSAKTTTPKKSSGKAKAKSKSKVVTEVAAPAPVVAPEPTPTPAPAPTPATSALSSLEELEAQFASINARLSELRALESSIVKEVRVLQKSSMKYLKEVQKKSRRKKKTADPNGVKRSPSGFAKPALISKELCSFLGKPQGTEMARTEVTKFLTAYIKQHELQDPENRRRIKPDKKLQKLLNSKSSDEVTYFNLQKYMKVHFPPSKASLAAAATTV